MSTPRVDRIFTAIDVGTWKVSAMIAGITESNDVMVLGTGWRASEGIKRGYVVDMERAELAIRGAVEQAERLAGVSIRDVWVGCSGAGLKSDIASVEVEIGGGRVEQEDLDNLHAASREVIQPNGQLVLHAQPALYTLDGRSGVKRPKGLHADQLGVDIHVVLADGAPVRNIAQAVAAAHLNVNAVVAAPIATGLACLTPEERELGVALIEIGSAVTNLSLYIGGMLVGLKTIGFGSGDVTDAIASAFGIQRGQAERLKTVNGSAISSSADHRTMVPVYGPNDEATSVPQARGADEHNRIPLAELNSVIRQQLDYLLGDVSKSLRGMGFGGSIGHQVVLTGGGAELQGLADYAQSALGKAVRIGKPPPFQGIPEAHGGPSFSTAAGLVLYGHSDPVDIRSLAPAHQMVHGMGRGPLVQRLLRAVRESF